MIRIILLATLALLASAAPGLARPADTENGSVPTVSPADTVKSAIVDVNSQLEHLRKIQLRRASGKRVTISDVRSASASPTRGREALDEERRRIETLRDGIRVLVERRSEPSPVSAPDVKTDTPDETAGPVIPEVEPTPVPDDHSLRIHLATLRYRAGRFEEALTLYESVARDIGDTWAILRTARCNERLGRITSARKIYADLIENHPNDAWARSAARSLSILDLGKKPVVAKEDE
jgi:tetratricopeptide (TPR) repeat protein